MTPDQLLTPATSDPSLAKSERFSIISQFAPNLLLSAATKLFSSAPLEIPSHAEP